MKCTRNLFDKNVCGRVVKISRQLHILVRTRNTAIEPDVVPPAPVSRRRELKQRQNKSLCNLCYGYQGRRPAMRIKQLQTPSAQLLDASRQHRAEQLLFSSEIVVNQCQVDLRAISYVACRN